MVRIPFLDTQVPGLVLFGIFMVIMLAASAALIWAGTRHGGHARRGHPRPR